MRKFRVYGLHPEFTCVESLLGNNRSLCKNLHSLMGDMGVLEHYPDDEFIWDDENPDYLFATEFIYCDRNYAEKFMRLAPKAAIRVFIACEAIAPDLNIFDYALVWDKKMQDRDRIISINAFLWDFHELDNDFTQEEAIRHLKSGLRFCNFIYSNSTAHPSRDKLFYALSKYKHIDSLGKHLNNVNTLIYGNGEEISIRIKNHYKFSIAAENALYDGYTSEKLLTSLQAHTVPIYFGNPYVSDYFNPEAFVNCNDFKSFDEVVARVKEIDEDDELWAYMVSRYWQTPKQKEASRVIAERQKEFMRNLFAHPIEEMKRRPEGTWVNLYSKWFFEHEFAGGHGFLWRLWRLMRNPQKIRNKIRLKMMPVTDIDDFFNDQGEKI